MTVIKFWEHKFQLPGIPTYTRINIKINKLLQEESSRAIDGALARVSVDPTLSLKRIWAVKVLTYRKGIPAFLVLMEPIFPLVKYQHHYVLKDLPLQQQQGGYHPISASQAEDLTAVWCTETVFHNLNKITFNKYIMESRFQISCTDILVLRMHHAHRKNK